MGLSRRKLLLAGGGVICAQAIGCGSEPIVLPKEIPAENASDLTAGSLVAVSAAPAAIGRDSGGIYAMTLVCTHEGCDIRTSQGGSVTPTRIHCGCHGSEYNGQGAVLLGPSTRPLNHLQVTADATGALTIHGDMVVPANARLSV
ncbi:MAG TPA: Rieske (2Fe-2S) protein [Myxococcales bacterium]|nr:Rieske (2Fe-2S) protein [Myxococcales bacterium]